MAGVAEYAHLGEGFQSLYRLRTALAESGAKLRVSRLDAGAFRSVASAGAWQESIDQVAIEANDWRQMAQNQITKYQAATAVWKNWMKPGSGRIWRLLEPVVNGAIEQAEQTRILLDALADPVRREAEIELTDRKEIKRQKGQDIDYGALNQLHSKTEAAIQFAHRWLALVAVRPRDGDYVSRELAELRTTVVPLTEKVLSDLGPSRSKTSGD